MPASSSYTVKEPLWLALMVVIGMVVGSKLTPESYPSLMMGISDDSHSGQIGRIEEVIRFIEAKYVEDLDEDALINNAVTSLFSELDPHSTYIPPEQLLGVEEDMKGLYEGIGVLTIFRNDTLYIQRVLKDSPAEKAGILVGDRIISIDKTKMSGTGDSYSEIRSGLQFKHAETKQVFLLRNGQLIQLPVTSEPIRVSAVESAYLLNENTVYIQLKRFSENVYNEFLQSLDSLITDPSKEIDLVLDLRDNPGGYLPETIKILNQIFKDKEKLLVYTIDRKQKKAEYKTNGNRFYNIEKVAVLINQNSASASEIIAGAIQDWDRGIVLGEPSFGKGLVQEQYKLKNGGAIRLTVSKYHTPTGRLIQKPYNFDFASLDQDSTEFYTMDLKRKVNGSGGITPDLIIPSSTELQTESCLVAREDLGFFFAKEIKTDISNEDFPLFFKNYLAFLKETYNIEAENICESDVQNDFDQLVVSYHEGSQAMIKSKNQHDPVVLKAISQLKRSDYFSF